MHPYQHAASHPDKLAFVIADTGETLTYRQLDDGSNRVAQLFRALGLQPGDRVGVMLKNSREFPIIYWGAQRSGIFLALLSSHLKAAEAAYILNDSSAKAFITSADDVGAAPVELVAQRGELIPLVKDIFDTSHQPFAGARSLHEALAALPTTPIADQTAGYHLLYSSCTTGRPKGILHKFNPGPIEQLSPSDSSVDGCK